MSPQSKSFVPVIIIGAGRSGTNMLRDVLTRLPGFVTWPCDEINYIWRHGNAAWPTDELSPKQATPQVQRYIRKVFAKLATWHECPYVVEKTCANSLRIGFVKTIFPEAMFIHIIRDGRDVVASAYKRWKAPLDLQYVFRKARFVPLSDFPYYATAYVWNRGHRLLSGEGRLAFWGPRFAGMTEIVQQLSLEEVCALQWCRCVEKATQELALFPPARSLQLRYEDFVAEPVQSLQTIVDFLGVQLAPDKLFELVAGVQTDRVGKAAKELGPERLAVVEALLKETLAKFGYA
jgi:hypothetical protein